MWYECKSDSKDNNLVSQRVCETLCRAADGFKACLNNIY